MDWINKINMIVEKMKLQMHAKGIDSLDKVFIQIAQYDKSQNGLLNTLQFEPFLSKLGIFLKTQELTEIHKYLNTYENGAVSFEHFVNLLKCDVPEAIIAEVKNVFNKIKETSTGTISYENLMKQFNVEHHPQVKLMHKEVPLVLQEFEVSVKFILGDKTIMTEEEFIELHRNMYWVTPRENITYFFKMIPSLWSA